MRAQSVPMRTEQMYPELAPVARGAEPVIDKVNIAPQDLRHDDLNIPLKEVVVAQLDDGPPKSFRRSARSTRQKISRITRKRRPDYRSVI